MELQKIKILSWNTRGLGGVEKCNVVKNVIKESRCDVCCLQETKWNTDDPLCHAKALPNFFERRCAALLAIGSSGGTIISWKRSYTLVNSWTTTHTVSALLKQEATGATFIITSVYGPSADEVEPKRAFIQELRMVADLISHPWILLGDFNLTRWLTDRPGDLRGLSLMQLFNDLIRELEVEDVPLQNRAYTWCSKRPDPNFSKIDRVFLTPGWAIRFPLITLRALEMVVSDHCPLVLSCSQRSTSKKEPRWENFWFDFPEVKEKVSYIWCTGDLKSHIGLSGFYAKTESLHKELMAWHKSKFGKISQRLNLCKELILQYDKLEEHRPLHVQEFSTRQKLRQTVFELANIEEQRWLQRSRCL